MDVPLGINLLEAIEAASTRVWFAWAWTTVNIIRGLLARQRDGTADGDRFCLLSDEPGQGAGLIHCDHGRLTDGPR